MVYCRILAEGKLAVMTSFTTPGNALVIKNRRRKFTSGNMTGIAIILGWDMGVWFTGGNNTVMASATVIKNVAMVEGGSSECVGC